MIDIYDKATNQLIGSITEADLQVLVDALEEESRTDQDYYVTGATIDIIADGRATDHLVNVLRNALGSKEGVDIRWERRASTSRQ
jgi:processive 1,2-diacylglycerol beta-glucosyltransferase